MVFPWIKQETGRCAEPLMLKYRESNLIRAGFIGVVLVILVIAVGLAAGTAAVQWATSHAVPGAVLRGRRH